MAKMGHNEKFLACLLQKRKRYQICLVCSTNTSMKWLMHLWTLGLYSNCCTRKLRRYKWQCETLTLSFLKRKNKKQVIKDPPCDEPNPLLYTRTKIHYMMYNLEGKYAHQVENNLSTPKLPTHHCTTLCFLDQDPSLHNIIYK